jgi:hypothetical protein
MDCFAPLAMTPVMGAVPDQPQSQIQKEFFGSFLQKRTAFFLSAAERGMTPI